MNKPWPADNKIVSFTDIVEPIRDAVNQAYDLKRKRGAIKWTGLDIGKWDKAGCPSPDDDLSSSSLAYHRERDRDPMDVIIATAVRLGIEQGRRLHIEQHRANLEYLAVDLATRAERVKEMINT